MHSLGSEVFARDLDIFGGNIQSRAALDGSRVVESFSHRHHHPAFANCQIQRLIKPATGMFQQHILAGDTEIAGAILYVGRDV